MTTADTRFYFTGGNLERDARSYVERQADRDLYDALGRGEFCYVLDSRQMGKSSLMVRTASRLCGDGIRIAALDLTALGQNLSPEQWYLGLLLNLGRALDLEDELEQFWEEHERLSPLQRWMAALREVVLGSGVQAFRPGTRAAGDGVQEGPSSEPERPNARTPERPPSLVIFIDEIDAVRSLAFSTDEFFAAIRECYNRRTRDPEFHRLTFCLLGVATPSDLIRDTRTTPFNIGRRIELTDFTEAEAAPLAAGFLPTSPPAPPLQEEGRLSQRPGASTAAPPSLAGKGAGGLGPALALLKRVLYWTGGHPYLTQRLCRAVAEASASPPNPKSKIQNPKSVDRLCEELFLSHRGREQDDNLVFVRERLLRALTPEGAAVDRAALLELYGRVRSGENVPADRTDPLVEVLRLSGIARAAEGVLRVRNRIYERVFDRAWVTQNMPDAELRRQRAAFRRGVLRTTAVAAVVLAVMAGLAITAMKQARRAEMQRRLAQAGQQTLRRHLYTARLNLALQAWEEGNIRESQDLLESQRPSQRGDEDLRGFEWRLLWRLCERGTSLFTFPEHVNWPTCVAFSPDSRILATGDAERTVKLWDIAARRQIARLPGSGKEFSSVAFSPNGRTLAAGSADHTIRLWDVPRWQAVATLRGHTDNVTAVAFSPDSRILASGSADGTIRLWDLAARRDVAVRKADARIVVGVAFSPAGRSGSWLLASGGLDKTAKLWNVIGHPPKVEEQPIAILQPQAVVNGVAFSPDGKLLATGTEDASIQLWEVARRKKLALFRGHTGSVNSVAFSPDGQWIASASHDNTVKLWAVGSGGAFQTPGLGAIRQETATLKGHRDHVNAVAFAANGKILASVSTDHTVRVWSTVPRSEAEMLRGHRGWVNAVLFSRDGERLLSAGGDGTLRLWNASTGQPIATWRGHRSEIGCAALSPNGKLLASGSDSPNESGRPGELKLWDFATRQELATLAREPRGVHALAFSPDGALLAAEHAGQSVRLWDVRSRRAAATLTPENQGPTGCIRFSPDGKTLATASWDLSVKLWNIATRKVTQSIPALFSGGECLAFAPDGRTLAVANATGGVKLWDVARKRWAATLPGATWPVLFSPDGKRVVSGAPGDRIKLWDVNTWEAVATLRGHPSSLQSLAFSPDGTTLASGCADGIVRLWRAATQPEADPLQLLAGGGDRTVTLQWRPVPTALGYNVYRAWERGRPARIGPDMWARGSRVLARSDRGYPRSGSWGRASGPRSQEWLKLTPQPLTGTFFTDQSPGLVNGRPQTYGVASVYPGAPGRPVQGMITTVRAVPVAAPPDYRGYSINEGEEGGAAGGSVSFDPSAGEITLRGAGPGIYDTADGFYFASRPVSGDFTVTVRALTRPTGHQQLARAGLMIRESLEPGARNTYLYTTPLRGLIYQWRPTANETTNDMGVIFDPPRFPMMLRLNRRGSTLTAGYSLDNGRRFQPVGNPLALDPPLAPTVYVGLANSSQEVNEISEAKFDGLQIEKR